MVPIPRSIPEEILQEIFSKDPARPCIAKLRKGFAKLGLYEIATSLPLLLHLLRPNEANQLNDVYAAFSKYVLEAASGRRSEITFRSILQNATGLDEEPPLGFELQPSIQFVAATKELKWSFVPEANTCSKTMFLPRGSHCLPLPAEEGLFYVYDAAFSNTYFGLA